MKEFNFGGENTEQRRLLSIAQEIEERMITLVANEPEKSKDEFAEIAAKILFEKFGGERFDLAAEYIVAEGIVIGMAARSLKEGYMGQIMEGSLRMNIRMRINEMESAGEE